ncbi:ferritin-like domain-containing protein [Hymenobacter sp. HMF4947]|uniref:Ferritin-like domain-containing protein n=1 Tax=Hymenobacter ginkgonis TaxID=2682976 RepID=A0A7K1TEH9_9BACT|nr:ferritin-like domain-containing protein [Hymenobacter ginkgonis]MVN76794.1 ferritin-like domain-containing protein [Hymenobacter ginkgonis]
MNFFAILDQLATADPDVLGRFDSRRAVFKHLGSAARRAALAATPLLVGGLFKKAYAGTNADTPIDILNYALALEYLEQDFYAKFIASGLVPAGAPATAMAKIKQHEDGHVNLLKGVITTLGGTPRAMVQFKQSVFDANKTYAGLLGVAQLLEDTGVRAYKGRAAELVVGASNGLPSSTQVSLLTTALQIHSVEARHAAHIRLLRGQTPWVSNSDDLAANATYSGATPEATTIQSNVDLPTKLAATYSAADVAAAFDEALTPAEVLDASRAGGLIQ